MHFEWHRSDDNVSSAHMSQTAHIDAILHRFHLAQANPKRTPYRSGLVIDRIPHEGVPVEEKLILQKEFQIIVG